ncbi:MAG TPA: hypothetical protein VH643_09485 [Gemmataceae bacterium]|jgi:hypothetical protein
MSETVLKILIDELSLIRLVCEKCGAALELPIDRLNGSGHIKTLACPAGCGNYRVSATYQSDTLAKFAEIVRDLKQVKGCRIELVLPVQPTKP